MKIGWLIAMMTVSGLPLPARAAVPEQALLAYVITPGKPNAASERITLSRDGEDYHMVVECAPYGQERQQEEAEVTAQEFAAVWDVVAQQRLLQFVPEEEKGVVYDFGVRELHMEVKETATAKRTLREWVWGRPLKNEAPVEALVKSLAHLAQAHAQSIKLYYFPKGQ